MVLSFNVASLRPATFNRPSDAFQDHFSKLLPLMFELTSTMALDWRYQAKRTVTDDGDICRASARDD